MLHTAGMRLPREALTEQKASRGALCRIGHERRRGGLLVVVGWLLCRTCGAVCCQTTWVVTMTPLRTDVDFDAERPMYPQGFVYLPCQGDSARIILEQHQGPISK